MPASLMPRHHLRLRSFSCLQLAAIKPKPVSVTYRHPRIFKLWRFLSWARPARVASPTCRQFVRSTSWRELHPLPMASSPAQVNPRTLMSLSERRRFPANRATVSKLSSVICIQEERSRFFTWLYLCNTLLKISDLSRWIYWRQLASTDRKRLHTRHHESLSKRSGNLSRTCERISSPNTSIFPPLSSNRWCFPSATAIISKKQQKKNFPTLSVSVSVSLCPSLSFSVCLSVSMRQEQVSIKTWSEKARVFFKPLL